MKKIFIGGCDRSGTTFLASVLGKIPNSIVTPESLFKTEDFSFHTQNFNINRSIERLKNDWRFNQWEIEIQELVTNSSKSAYTIGGFYEKLTEEYAKKLNLNRDIKFWIDHSPNNFECSNGLLNVYPDAKFIHIIRDGRAVAYSMFNLNWGANTGLFAGQYWAKKIANGLAFSYSQKTKVLTVKYEDLISNSSFELKRITTFLEIPEITLSINESVDYFLPEFTKKQHNKVGKSADKSKIKSWEKNISNDDLMQFEYMAGSQLENIGYTKTIGNSQKFSFYKLASIIVKEIFYKFIINPYLYAKNRR